MTHSASAQPAGTAAITGATGLIGSSLLVALSRSGYTCRPLVRRPPRDATEIAWDPERGTIDSTALEGVDVVVHLAGENIGQRWTDARMRRIRESRARGTSLLASTIGRLARPPRVVVSMSAIGIYGDRGDEELDESASSGADFLAEVCKVWESSAQPIADRGIRLVTPRMGVVMSPRGGALARLLPVFRLGLGGRVGNGRQWMSWIGLADVIRGLLFAVATESLAGPVNFVAPNPVNNAEFTRALAQVLRRPAVFPVPRVALELALGEMARETILASQRVRPRALLQAGFEFEAPTIESALRMELKAPSS